VSPTISSDVIELAGRRLAAAARQPARVLLFGSHARGDASPDSDLDFLVIERDVPNRHAEMVRLTRELAELRDRGQDRDWLAALVAHLYDIRDRHSASVRKGLEELKRGELEPA
jgi:predicted nucleotidyltransferase